MYCTRQMKTFAIGLKTAKVFTSKHLPCMATKIICYTVGSLGMKFYKYFHHQAGLHHVCYKLCTIGLGLLDIANKSTQKTCFCENFISPKLPPT